VPHPDRRDQYPRGHEGRARARRRPRPAPRQSQVWSRLVRRQSSRTPTGRREDECDRPRRARFSRGAGSSPSQLRCPCRDESGSAAARRSGCYLCSKAVVCPTLPDSRDEAGAAEHTWSYPRASPGGALGTARIASECGWVAVRMTPLCGISIRTGLSGLLARVVIERPFPTMAIAAHLGLPRRTCSRARRTGRAVRRFPTAQPQAFSVQLR